MEQTDNKSGMCSWQPHEVIAIPNRMALAGNKTIMCSVLFLDIVAYSRKSVSQQMEVKNWLNSALASAISLVPMDDRIILDTGDGAAISFLSDAEDALRVALMLRQSMFEEGARLSLPLMVRMGINLGPVRLIRDNNGQPNIVGDGINVAQRVMEFSEDGQILISRSYYEAISNFSHVYAGMLHYHGKYTDKHVREHEVYAVGNVGDMALSTPDTDETEVVDNPDIHAGGHPGIFEKFSSRRSILIGSIFVGVVLLVAAKLINVESRDARPAPTALVEPVETAILTIAVTPWGEVYLDGKIQGISPPLAELKIKPGIHQIEIRNKTFPQFSQNFKINPGEKKDIRYKFVDPLN